MPNRMSEPEAESAAVCRPSTNGWSCRRRRDLNELFEQLRVASLGTFFSWQGRIVNPGVRELLESAADRLAAANTTELVRLVAASQ